MKNQDGKLIFNSTNSKKFSKEIYPVVKILTVEIFI